LPWCYDMEIGTANSLHRTELQIYFSRNKIISVITNKQKIRFNSKTP